MRVRILEVHGNKVTVELPKPKPRELKRVYTADEKSQRDADWKACVEASAKDRKAWENALDDLRKAGWEQLEGELTLHSV